MTIRQQGGIFGRNPTFRDVDVEGDLTAASIDINGGTIDGTVIGGSTPAAISGTTGSFSGNLTVDTNTLFVDAASNNVGIGTSSPNASYRLDVKGALPAFFTADSTAVSPTYGGVGFYRPTNTVGSGNGIQFALNNASDVQIEYGYIGGLINTNTADAVEGSLLFATSTSNNRTERMRLDPSGHLIVPAGITLGTAAGVYNANNTLDDYEKGTWTPTITDLSGTEVSGYSGQVGHYTKIGNMVYAVFRVALTNIGSITGNYTLIKGLPFNHTGVDAGSGIINVFQNLNNAVSGLSIELGGGNAAAGWFTKVSGTSATSNTYLQTADVSNTFVAQGSLIYRTS